jgi:hypothetical protein
MEINKAIEILKKHNEWRRCNEFPSSKEMVNPTELGIAIDVVVKELSQKHNQPNQSKRHHK